MPRSWYIERVMASKPRLYWPLDEASLTAGNSVLPQDRSGNAFHSNALLVPGDGTVRMCAGPCGPGDRGIHIFHDAAYFYNTAAVSTAVDNVTFEIWAKYFSGAGARDPAWYNGNPASSGLGMQIRHSLDITWIAGGTAFGNPTNTKLILYEWSHIVVLRRSGRWEYWINGMYDSASGQTTTPGSPSASFQLGDNNTANDTEVEFAHGAYYERALTSNEIISHYAAALPPRQY
jgi:Concanavalin A-like lectin/glucanases superfamily